MPPNALSAEAFISRLVRDMAGDAAQLVRPHINSRTLREAMTILHIEGSPTAILWVPHYWAPAVHNGRRGFTKEGSGALVFFANPDDDPRIDNSARRYPMRFSDVKKLSEADYRDGLEKNALRRAAGLPPYMIVVKHVGPTTGNPFFTDALADFSERILPIVRNRLSDWIKSQVSVKIPVARGSL